MPGGKKPENGDGLEKRGRRRGSAGKGGGGKSGDEEFGSGAVGVAEDVEARGKGGKLRGGGIAEKEMARDIVEGYGVD